MKIQYASDLHLEMGFNSRFVSKNMLIPVGDILLLAGDIAYLDSDKCGHENYGWFLDFCKDNFKQTLIVPGNHEFYDFYDVAKLSDGYCKELRDNVKIYYNSVVRIEDTDFILSTLWSHIPQIYEKYTEKSVSDFYRIRYYDKKLTAVDFNKLHEHCLDFIKESVNGSDAKHKVVVTHHVPSNMLTSTEFIGSYINGAFTVELCDYIENSGIDYWVYGHSHRNIDAEIGSTKCVTNQLGYVYQENTNFKLDKFFEIS